MTAGTGGNLGEDHGGGNPSMEGIGDTTTPENIFNFGGTILIDNESQEEYDFDGRPILETQKGFIITYVTMWKSVVVLTTYVHHQTNKQKI